MRTVRFIAWLWFTTSGIAAAQTVVNSVAEALALARQRNPDVQNARLNRELQRQQVQSSRAALRPQARVFGGLDYNYSLPIFVIPPGLFGSTEGRVVRVGFPYVLTGTAEVTAPLVNRPARADVRLAEQNARVIDDQTLVLEDEVATQTARVYHATLLTREAIALTARNVATADTLVRIARERLNKGLIEPLELNRIRAVYLTTADVLEQNRLAYQRNINQLKLLLGLRQTDSLRLAETLAAPTDFATLPATDAPRPQLRLAQTQLELARQQLAREDLLRWPTLSAYGRYQQQAQRQQFNFLNATLPWFEIGAVGLTFNIPIYAGGLRLSNVARGRLQLRLAEQQLQQEGEQQALETADVRNSYEQAVRSLALNRQGFDLSQQNVQIALVKYRSGLFAYDQYLNVFNDAITAQNRYLTTLSNAFINQTLWQIRSGQ